MKKRSKEEMRAYQKARRERVTPIENVTPKAVTPQNVTPTNVTPCDHAEIVPVVGCGHLTYSKVGRSLPWFDPDLSQPKLVTCPCCGKEWNCRRPHIQDAYCLKCSVDRPTEHWRQSGQYKRPPMEPATVLEGIFGNAAR